jgi:hypothetical protein
VNGQRLWVAFNPQLNVERGVQRGLLLTGCLNCNSPVNTYFNVAPIFRDGLTNADRACSW